MIRICNILDKDIIDNYITSDYGKCLYLYLNYKKYGFTSSNVKMYISLDTKVNALLLEYYDCIHIYSKDLDYNLDEMFNFINEINPKVICAERNIIENLSNLLKDKYNREYGYVKELKNYSLKRDECVIKANISDFKDIANLICTDKEFVSTYNVDNLYSQISERNSEGYGRSYIIKDGEAIIAHAGTSAENDSVAVISYVIIKENYRRKGLATKVVGTLCHDLTSEGKKVFLISYSVSSLNLYDKLGFIHLCDWGKLYLKD